MLFGVVGGSVISWVDCAIGGFVSRTSSAGMGVGSSKSIDFGSTSVLKTSEDPCLTFMLDSSGKKNISTPSFSVELFSSSSSTVRVY